MSNQKKTKILFILPTLTAGGAERVFAFVSQHIDRDKYQPRLLVTGYEKDAAYKIDKIPLDFLNKNRVLHSVPSLFKYLTKNKPDIVISSIGHLNTIMGFMSFLFSQTKFIIREASVVSVINKIHGHDQSNKYSFNFHKILSKVSYQFVDGIICQSQDMANDFVALYNIPKNKIHIINNPITNTPYLLKKTVSSPGNPIKYITVGRLSKEKGHNRIIRLLSQLDYPFHYTLIGDGPLKFDILKSINDYQLIDNFTHIPYTEKVFDYLSSSDLFLQGSFVEGFPNAVLESCMAGTPVLAYNVPGGTKEIIKHGINGYLVNSEEQFLKCIQEKINFNPVQIRKSVEEKFSTTKIIDQYELLFDNI